MHFDENTEFGRATVLCNSWIRFWVKGKGIYRKTLEWVIKGSKYSIGYLSTGLCNNSSSCKEKNCCCTRQQWLAPRNSASQILASWRFAPWDHPATMTYPATIGMDQLWRPSLTCNGSDSQGVMCVGRSFCRLREQMWSFMLPQTSLSCLGCCKPVSPIL